MRVYSIHIRRHGLDIERDIAVVKEGFSWPAFVFNGVWAIWHRHWLLAVALFLIPAVIAGITRIAGLEPTGQAVLSGAWSVIVGMVANDMRRYFLDRDGFVEAAVAAGRSPDEALYAHLEETPLSAPTAVTPTFGAAPSDAISGGIRP